jgi:hypothetical protein
MLSKLKHINIKAAFMILKAAINIIFQYEFVYKVDVQHDHKVRLAL